MTIKELMALYPAADRSQAEQAIALGTAHGRDALEPLTEDELATATGTTGADPEPYTVAYMEAFEAAYEASTGVAWPADDSE